MGEGSETDQGFPPAAHRAVLSEACLSPRSSVKGELIIQNEDCIHALPKTGAPLNWSTWPLLVRYSNLFIFEIESDYIAHAALEFAT